MKEKIRKEYYRRVRMVLKTELNAANKFEAINTLAIAVVTSIQEEWMLKQERC